MTAGPHFFCENCGAEVPLTVKRCPGCGRFFESVRCPKCGLTGTESQFTKGCPGCGYSPGRKFRKKTPEEGALPFWIYIILAALATAVFAALFMVLV
jgi:predicted amidophosphoribosyltransferase